MDNAITTFTKTLASFCNHIETSCDGLKQSIDRRPVPLDSASSTFIQRLNRRLSSASADLNLLDSMSFGTVSFEELLGHCWEVFKKNQHDMTEVEDHLKGLGYVSEFGDFEDVSGLSTPDGSVVKVNLDTDGVDSASPPVGLASRRLEDDSLWEESPSVQSLGLSKTSLAALQNKAEHIPKGNLIFSVGEPIEVLMHKNKMASQIAMSTSVGENAATSKPILNISQEDYGSLPSYLKSLSSWEDLLNAVKKLNLKLRNQQGDGFLGQDDIESLELGPRTRSYLLLLVRMKRLVVETKDGLICYKVLGA